MDSSTKATTQVPLLFIILLFSPKYFAQYTNDELNQVNRTNKVLNEVPHQVQLNQFQNNKHVPMYSVNRDDLHRVRPVPPLDVPPLQHYPQKHEANSLALSDQVVGDHASHGFHNNGYSEQFQFAAKTSGDNGRASTFLRTTTARPPKMRLFAPPTKMATSKPQRPSKWPRHHEHHDHNDHHQDHHRPQHKHHKYHEHHEPMKHLYPIKHRHSYDKKVQHYMSGDVGIKYMTAINDVAVSGHESPAPIKFIKVSEPMEYKVPVTTFHYSNQAHFAPKRFKEDTKLPEDYKFLPYPPSFITFTTTTEKPVIATYAYATPVPVPPSTSTGYLQKLKDKFKFPISFKPDFFNHREPQSLLESYIPSWEIHKMMQQYDHKPLKESQVHVGHTLVYVVPMVSKPNKGFFRNKWQH